MNGAAGLYGDMDMARVMYGEHARHIPAWMYVQDQGPGVVGLVGASRVPSGNHPLTYGGGHYQGAAEGHSNTGKHYYAHHFIVGEIIVRPHIVIGTNALTGMGAGGLYIGDHDIPAMLADGAVVAGSDARLRAIRKQWEG